MTRTRPGLTSFIAAGALAATAATTLTLESCTSGAQSLRGGEKTLIYQQHELDAVRATEQKLPFVLFSRDPKMAVEYNGTRLDERVLLDSMMTPESNVRTISGKDEIKDPDNVFFLVNAYVEGDELYVNTGTKPRDIVLHTDIDPQIRLDGTTNEAIQRRIYAEMRKNLSTVNFRDGTYVSLEGPNPFGPDHAFVRLSTVRPVRGDTNLGAGTGKVVGVRGHAYFLLGPIGENDVYEVSRRRPKVEAPRAAARAAEAEPEIQPMRTFTGYSAPSE